MQPPFWTGPGTQTLAGFADRGRTAEAAGYDGLWSAESAHHPFLPLVAAAHGTTRLELGTAITVAFARNPCRWLALRTTFRRSPRAGSCSGSAARSDRTFSGGSTCPGASPLHAHAASGPAARPGRTSSAAGRTRRRTLALPDGRQHGCDNDNVCHGSSSISSIKLSNLISPFG